MKQKLLFALLLLCMSLCSASVYAEEVEEDSIPHITVNLLEPGSLGTEILYNVDNIRDVKWLKVIGTMNADDWAKIAMMKDSLVWLDLSEATTNSTYTKLADSFFSRTPYQVGGEKNWQYLRYVHFPKGLKEIGSSAFYASNVDSVSIPDIEKMGDDAFQRASNLKVIRLSNKITEIRPYTFRDCVTLVSVFDAHNLKNIRDFAFYACGNLKDLDMSKVETIGTECFAGNWNLDPGDLLYLKELGYRGLRGTMLKKIVLSCIEKLQPDAFGEIYSLEEVEFPSYFTNFDDFVDQSDWNAYNRIFNYCPSLRRIKFNASCVVTGNRKYMFNAGNNSSTQEDSITIYVPKYLVNYYKQDSYWYQFKIEGFDVEDPENYTIDIRSNMVMNNRERFEGSPNIFIRSAYLKINGENSQELKKVDFQNDAQIFSNCENIHVNGELRDHYLIGEAKRWYFISLPFDCVISKTLETYPSTQFAFRFYDGASRAVYGAAGNWKNYEVTDIIPAGTGFILQTNVAGWYAFFSADNESKQNVFSPREFVKTLDVNESEVAANRGWNLIGNPYQTYYNTHMLNFTGPITVWNGNNNYVAYSTTDDDYAIAPNQAFFVQCPNEEYNTIGFPIQGRQLTPVIESQNAVRERVVKAKDRKLVNLTISNGEVEDQTRIVMNEMASMEYETECDASKFMSMDGSVPQIFTIDTDGTKYAINERPMSDGTVQLGFYAGQTGDYTIAVGRCDTDKLFLTDLMTGTTTELTNGEYTFTAEAGNYESRFVLSFVQNAVTAISNIATDCKQLQTEVYSVGGKFMGKDVNNLNAGVYVVRQGNKVNKIVVR